MYFGDIMANLGLIDFKIGMYIEVNIHIWQNNFDIIFFAKCLFFKYKSNGDNH